METYGLTHPGNKRETNEDAVLINDNIGLLVLADGMGGHAAGDVASQIAVEVINDAMEAAFRNEPARSDDSFYIGVLRASISRANAAIYQQGQSEASTRGMGSTVVATLVRSNRLFVAHVGDSRCYRYQDGRFVQITKDHSKVQEMIDAGQLAAGDAKHHMLSNLLTRSLGPYPTVDIDVNAYDWTEDKLIFLCSDGLTNELSDEQIQQVIETYADIKDKCRALVGQSLEGAARDNISILICQGDHFAPDAKNPPEKLVELTPENMVEEKETPISGLREIIESSEPPAESTSKTSVEFAPKSGPDRSPSSFSLGDLGKPLKSKNRVQFFAIATAILIVLIILILLPIYCDRGPQDTVEEAPPAVAPIDESLLNYYLLFDNDSLVMTRGTAPETASTLEGTGSLVWDNMSLVIRGRGFTPSEGGLFYKQYDNLSAMAEDALNIYSSIIDQGLSLQTSDGIVLAFSTLIQIQRDARVAKVDPEIVKRTELETFTEAMPILDEVLKNEYETGGAWIARTDRIFDLAEQAFELEGERLGQYRSRKGDYHYYQGLYYASRNINDRAFTKFEDAKLLGTSFPDIDAKIEEAKNAQ